MALSEIEKLERRYAENPQGLTFAPLAEVHRKNGDVQRALELLGPGLDLHPDYIPASIVLGRCHLDLGDVHQAEKAFQHVLALDGENVIALKALADISERLFRFKDAEQWLTTLLSVDHSNTDAREQLQRVEISRRQAEAASSAELEGVAEAEAEPETLETPVEAPAPFEPPVAEPARGWVSQSISQVSESPSPDLAAFQDPSVYRGPLEEPAGIRFEDPAAGDYEEPAGLQYEDSALSRGDDPLRLEEPVEPVDGLVGRELDSPGEPGDFRVETSEDIVLRSVGGGEFQVPDASQELSSTRRADQSGYAERDPFEEDAPVRSSARADTEMPEPAHEVSEEHETPAPSEAPAEDRFAPTASVEPEATAPAEEASPPAPEPAAAETWAAEPYPLEPPASYPDAPQVYAPEPPAPPAPSTPVPTTAGAEVRMEGVGNVWDQPRNGDVDGPFPAAAPPRRSYTVQETGGQSVVHFFQGLLSGRPPAQSAATPVREAEAAGGAGAPTRPAADSLSLSSVFGEETSASPPAVPAASAGQGPVSFDEFFDAPSASPAARTPRAPDPKNDDLDQFHAWLQNLKR